MRVSARRSFIRHQKQAEREMTALLRTLDQQIAGIVTQHTTRTGVLPLIAQQQVTDQAKAAVQAVYVARRTLTGVARLNELTRLQSLIDASRKAYKAAPATQQTRIAARIAMLTKRYQLLATQGVALVAFDEQGNPLTPFAVLLLTQATNVVTAGLKALADAIFPALDPLEVRQLETVRTPTNTDGLRDQSLLGWQDERGFVENDRIWAASEDAQTRIELSIGAAFLASTVGQKIIAAVHMALLGRTVTNALFAGKRLLRAEITRIFGVTMREGAKRSPVEMRGYWELSPTHDPKNCNGTCDKYAAQSVLNDGFSLDEIPTPTVDTHANCQCSVRFQSGGRKGDFAQSLANILTPLAGAVFTRWLIRGAA